MPISLLCGACGVKLNAPDTAAGKKVKCPKCGTVLQIPLPEPEPDFEVVDDEPAPPPKAKPKPKPVLLDEDDDDVPPPTKPVKKPAVVPDDDEDGDEELPRPMKKGKTGKGQSKKAAGSNRPLLVGGGVLGLVVVGALVWFLFLREPSVAKGPDTNTNPNPDGKPGPGRPQAPQPGGQVKPPPAGWKTFAGDGFACSVPSAVSLARRPDTPLPNSTLASGPRRDWAGGAPGVSFLVQLTPANDVVRQQVADDAEAGLRAFAGTFYFGYVRTEEKVVPVDGLTGVQLRFDDERNKVKVIVRLALHGDTVYQITAVAPDLTSEADERVKPFLDGFVIGTQFKQTEGQTKPPPAGWRTSNFPEFSVWQRLENAKPANQFFKDGLGPAAPGTRIVSNEDLEGKRNQVVMALPLDKATHTVLR